MKLDNLVVSLLAFLATSPAVWAQEPNQNPDQNPEQNHEEPDHEQEEWDREHHCEPPNDHCHPTGVPTRVPTARPTTPEPTFVYTIDFSDTVATKIFPSDGTEMDMYGSHVHIQHTTAVVGAYDCKEEGFGEKSGAVYIYATNATGYPYYDDGSTPWKFVQKLHLEKWDQKCNKEGCEYIRDEHYAENSEFGYAAAVWDDTMIVGAHKHADAHDAGGGAFVFTRTTSTGLWSQTATLSAGDSHDYHYFGTSIAMYDGTAVIGASGDDHQGTSSGAVYVFDYDSAYSSWVMSTKLTSGGDAHEFDNFGAKLAIYKSLLVVGASGDDELGADAGAAYVFIHWGSWQQHSKLTPYENGGSGTYNNFKFGCSVAIYETTVAVGAYYSHGHWDNAGAAYIYVQDNSGNWVFQKKLIAHDGMTEDKFGFSVALYKDTIVVGAWGEQGKEQQKQEGPGGKRYLGESNHRSLQAAGGPEHGENCGPNSPPDCKQYTGHYSYRGASSGAVYVFARSGSSWNQEFKLIPNGTSSYDAYGYSVDLHENVLFAGAYLADGQVANSGAAYIYAPPTMSPPTTGDGLSTDGGDTDYYAVTGAVELDALLAVCLILVPAAIAGVWYYTQYKKRQMTNDRIPVSTDSQHGSVAPWSMHGAFDDSSRGAGSRSADPPTRSPLVCHSPPLPSLLFSNDSLPV
jgi:hypothetical protein